jgi:hypothetical protein
MALLALVAAGGVVAGAALRRSRPGTSDELVRLAVGIVWLGIGIALLQIEGLRERFAARFSWPAAGVMIGVWTIPVISAAIGGGFTGAALGSVRADDSRRPWREVAAAALGIVGGLMLAMLLDRPSVAAAIGALLLFAAAAVRAILKGGERRATGRTLIAPGIIGMFAAALLPLVDGIAPRQAQAAPGDSRSAMHDGPDLAAGLAVIPGCTTRVFRANEVCDGNASDSFWQIDCGERADAIVLGAIEEPCRGSGSRLEREWGRRLVRRLYDRTLRGGRLVIERPTLPAVEAALQRYGAHAADSAARAYVLTLHGSRGEREAILVGTDIPEWLGRWPRPEGAQLTLRRWKDGHGPAVDGPETVAR